MENSYNNSNNEEIIHKFKFIHNGTSILISDILSDYTEVLDTFMKNSNGYFDTSKIINLINGDYDLYISEKQYDKFGLRVKSVTMFNSFYDYDINNNFEWNIIGDFGIDGGTCMIFTDSVLENKLDLDIFLEKYMSCEYDGNYLKYIINDKLIGIGMSSGYGDGFYNIYACFDNNNIIGIKINFINDNYISSDESSILDNDYESTSISDTDERSYYSE